MYTLQTVSLQNPRRLAKKEKEKEKELHKMSRAGFGLIKNHSPFMFMLLSDFYSHKAPASLSIFLSEPLSCRVITVFAEPTSLPPMNTAGAAGLHPSFIKADSNSFPLGSSSSSWIRGLTPCS